jgi:hypothetical protein
MKKSIIKYKTKSTIVEIVLLGALIFLNLLNDILHKLSYLQTEWDRVIHLLINNFPDPLSKHSLVTDMLELQRLGPVGQIWQDKLL